MGKRAVQSVQWWLKIIMLGRALQVTALLHQHGWGQYARSILVKFYCNNYFILNLFCNKSLVFALLLFQSLFFSLSEVQQALSRSIKLSSFITIILKEQKGGTVFNVMMLFVKLWWKLSGWQVHMNEVWSSSSSAACLFDCAVCSHISFFLFSKSHSDAFWESGCMW